MGATRCSAVCMQDRVEPVAVECRTEGQYQNRECYRRIVYEPLRSLFETSSLFVTWTKSAGVRVAGAGFEPYLPVSRSTRGIA